MSKKAGAQNSAVATYFLDPIEWDFRQILKREFHHAALYEYARTSNAVRGLWHDWMEMWVSTRHGERIQIKDVLTKHIDKFVYAPPETPLASKVFSTFPSDLRMMRLDALLLAAPEFPLPWLRIPPPRRREIVWSVYTSLPVQRTFRDVSHTKDRDEVRF